MIHRVYSWLCARISFLVMFGVHMYVVQRIKLRRLLVKQVPYPVYCLFCPQNLFFRFLNTLEYFSEDNPHGNLWPPYNLPFLKIHCMVLFLNKFFLWAFWLRWFFRMWVCHLCWLIANSSLSLPVNLFFDRLTLMRGSETESLWLH